MIFGRKKKEEGLFSQVDVRWRIVNDFRRRTKRLFENYRYVSYKKSPEYDLEQFMKSDSENLEKMIAAKAVDAGNEDCLVDSILGPVRAGFKNLDDQYLEHMDFYTRQGGNIRAHSADIQRILDMWEKQEEDISREHSLTLKLWDRYYGHEG